MVINRKTKAFPVRIVVLCLIVISITICGAFIWSGAAPSRAAAGPLDLSLSVFATGLNRPVGITNAGPGDDRLFVVEQAGVIKIVQADGTVLSSPFLDISARVDSSANEEGLLGLSFHPNYASNGYFYVNYTHTTSDNTRRTRISRFRVTTDPNLADPNSEEILLTVEQPSANHNAGDLHFGPDGYLYIPLGDGGGRGDPNNNAQNLGLLLGKIIRLDVDSKPGSSSPDCSGLGSANYTIPADNPLIDGPGGTCDEIWAVGLRNPWRFSFDRLTGDLYLGDVGQNTWEEIDFQAVSSDGGENYGWRCYEGNHDFNTSGCGPIENYTFPIFEYNQSGNGCSVTGGYVYRGSRYPAMYGRYLLTDYCTGNFWDLAFDGVDWQATKHTNLTAFGYVAFGEDATGELYVANISNGNIYHLEENTPSSPLSISKSGPAIAAAGSAITYTLTLTNSGHLTANNLVITDAIPSGAAYISGSGGVQIGSVVSWTINALAPNNRMTQTTFAVTATQTIVNNDYRVSAADIIPAIGNVSVTTIIGGAKMYLPLIVK